MALLTKSAFGIAFETRNFGDVRYYVPDYARHRPTCQAILKGTYWEPGTHRIVASLMKVAPGNIVHAGAFIGDMLPSFSRACGTTGFVYAFEPLLENYVLARLTVDHNRLSNVLLFNSGLGDRLMPCRVAHRGDKGLHAGGSSRISQTGGVSSAIVTVDGLGLDQLSILQLDVEGYELRALKGARKTLAASRPVVLIEDASDNCGSFLADIGYRRVGSIPGLYIWCPNERTDLISSVNRFIVRKMA